MRRAGGQGPRPGILGAMDTGMLRAIGGAVLVGTIAAGVWLSGKLARDSSARVTDVRGHERDLETARADARAQGDALVPDDAEFARAIVEDSERFGLAPIDLALLRAPHTYVDEVDEMVVLPPGRSWRSKHLAIEAVVDKVTYRQRGATVAANHTIALVENIGERPVAYFLRLASAERGRCEVRGSRMHNAQALRPGDVAEIVVCAGGGAIRIEDVQVLEVSELGHRYLSQVPPSAMNADDVTDAAHRPLDPSSGEPGSGKEIERCRLDPGVSAGPIQTGAATWADVADFFARHDCHRFAFPAGYRRATAPIPRLPAADPAPAP